MSEEQEIKMSFDSEDIEKKLEFISENINELRKSFRIEITKIIMGSQKSENKLHEKGNGSVIKYSDLSIETINAIYNYIKTKLASLENI